MGIIISISGILTVGLPSKGQVLHSLIVAVFLGIIATILFFKATNLVSNNIHKLAVIESTQSSEVIFTLLGGVFLFHDKIPTIIGFIRMIFNSIIKS